MMDVSKKYYEKAAENLYTIGDRKFVVDFLEEFVPTNGRILEIGCGTGEVVKHLRKDLLYAGLDSSGYAIKEAKNKYSKNSKIRFAEGELGEIDFPKEYFDAVLAIFVVEHLENPKFTLQEISKVLRPGGHLIILAPNFDWPLSLPQAIRHWSLFKKFLLRIFRIFDYFRAFFGIFSFRTVYPNFLDSEGKYEYSDDDLRYLCSGREVIGFLKKLGLESVYTKPFSGKMFRRLVTFLPLMSYYGRPLFVIMKKK